MSTSLRSITKIVRGIRQGASLTRLSGDSETGASTPVIQIGNLEPHGIDPESLKTELLDVEKARVYRVREGQILLSQFVSKLRAALASRSVAESGAVVGANVTIIEPDLDRVVPDYLLAMLSSRAFQVRIERLTGGSTTAQLSVSALKAFEIPVPPMAQQLALGKAFRASRDSLVAARRLTQAQEDLLEHAALDLWEGTEAHA